MSLYRGRCVSTVPQRCLSTRNISLFSPENQREETISEHVRLSVNNTELPDRWQKRVVRRAKKGPTVEPGTASFTHHMKVSQSETSAAFLYPSTDLRSMTYGDNFHRATRRLSAAFLVLSGQHTPHSRAHVMKILHTGHVFLATDSQKKCWFTGLLAQMLLSLMPNGQFTHLLWGADSLELPGTNNQGNLRCYSTTGGRRSALDVQ